MRFGIAKDLITPDVRTHMGGYGTLYGKRFIGVHDDIYVKTILLDDGQSKVVLISFDLLFHDFELTRRIGEYIRERHSIPAENLVVSYTHNHAGPALLGYDPGQHDDRYEAFLWERVRACIDRACVNTFTGAIEYGRTRGDWNISRRKPVNGKMLTLPNLEGDRDDSLDVLRIRDLDGQTKALVLNYSCHPVTLNDTLWISAEYPGRLCQLLDTDFYGCTSVFFQGAGGCSRPRITAGPNRWKKCTFEEVDEMAHGMAIAVKRLITSGGLRPVQLNLAATQFIVPLEVGEWGKDYFRRIVEDPKVPDSPHKNEARVVFERYDATDNVVRLPAAVVRLSSDLYIALLGGEVTWPVKQHVVRAFGDKDVIFIGYADATAYIPDDRYIREGGYEAEGSVVEFCLKGKFKPGVDRAMTEGFGRALLEIG